jgi:PAS domain S-box-containing protein
MLMLIPSERRNEEPEILALIGRGESVDHFETVRVRKDGKQIDVSATISPRWFRNSNSGVAWQNFSKPFSNSDKLRKN